MDQTWVCKIAYYLVIITIVYLDFGCSGDDSCGYEIKGIVKASLDSVPLNNVTVTELYYNIGDKEVGQDTINHKFKTKNDGSFSYEGWLIPQRNYSCPSVKDIELRYRFELYGYLTIDTTFIKGTIASNGVGERGKQLAVLPTIYLTKTETNN